MTLPWYFVLPADRDQPSGGNRYNEQLIRALRRAGQPTVIIDFAAYQEARRHDRPGRYFVDSLFVRDLASVTDPPPANLRTVFIVHHLASMDASSEDERAARLAEEAAAFVHVDTFLATSSFSERYLREQGIHQPVVVVEPGLDVASEPREFYADKVHGLMVANLIARKGILPWLQVVADRLKPTDAFTLTIVGRTDLEPAYARACRRWVEQQPALRSRVRFTGALPYYEVEEYYLRTHLFISAARLETFGMALQEAKAYRLPLLILAGGYAKQHVTSTSDGHVFNTLAEMADFFVDLVRTPAQLKDWQTTINARPPSTKYNWNQAARLLTEQLT